MMIDCGANVHFFTLEDARRYFSNYRSTSMSIVGISGTRDPCSAEGEINLSVVDSSGKHLNMSLGTGYSNEKLPHSLISGSLLLNKGAILHLERGNSYLEFPGHGGGKFALKERNGLFWLPMEELAQHSAIESVVGFAAKQALYEDAGTGESEATANHKAVNAKGGDSESNKMDLNSRPHIQLTANAAFGDVKTWHERMAHMSPATLKKIFEGDLVNGFQLKGQFTLKDCNCSACQLAKIRSKGARSSIRHKSPETSSVRTLNTLELQRSADTTTYYVSSTIVQSFAWTSHYGRRSQEK